MALGMVEVCTAVDLLENGDTAHQAIACAIPAMAFNQACQAWL